MEYTGLCSLEGTTPRQTPFARRLYASERMASRATRRVSPPASTCSPSTSSPVPYQLRTGDWTTREDELIEKWIDELTLDAPAEIVANAILSDEKKVVGAR